MTTLGEVPELRAVQTGPFGTQLKANEYASDGGVLLVSVGEIRAGAVQINDSTPRVSAATIERLPRFTLTSHDVVVARKGGVERSSWISPEYGPLFLGSDGIALRFESEVDARFWGLYLQQRSCKSWLLQHAAGSTMLSMNGEILRRLPVVLFDASERKRLAEVLGALDDKIAANRRVAELAVSLSEGIVSGAFSSQSLPLEERAQVVMGSSPKGEYLNEDGGGVTFFQGVRDFGLLSPTRRVFATQPVRMAQAGDVLFAVRAPVGEVNVAIEPTCIGRGLAALRAYENPVSFFYTVRASSHAWNEFQGTGTVFASVNGKEVRQTRLPVIDRAAAPEVEERVSAMHVRALGALAENEALAKTRDELLPLLMSGRITVRDAQKRVEGVV